MSGIAGIIKKTRAAGGAAELRAMLQSMIHEEFYRSGVYANDALGLNVGWVGLRDAHPDGQPAWNETRDVGLIFCGEDAADASDALGLRSRGHDVTPGDAGRLVHLYEEEGPEFLRRLNGAFSGILVDIRNRSVILFNDRYGLGRIYAHENEAGVYFASEAKALLKVLPELRRLEESAFGEQFAFGCTLGGKTLFPGVALMPCGSRWTFEESGRVAREVYFRPESWEEREPLGRDAFRERLRSTFSRVLPRYHRPPERLAVSLTGGIDTRMIMAWAEFPPYEVPCYTFSGLIRDCADVRIARKVADVCRQRHTTIRMTREFFAEFPALAKRTVYFTDGAMDVSGAVELYMNRQAREIAPVRLTGNYGDQVIRRVVGFRPGFPQERIFAPDFIPRVRAAAETYSAEDRGPRLSFFAFKQLPWHHYGRLAVERTQLIMRSPFLDNDLVSLMYQAPPEEATRVDSSLRLIAEGFPLLGRIPTDRGRRLGGFAGATAARRLFQELTFKAEYAFDYGMPPGLVRLDRRLSRLNLEKAFLGRHKFYHFRIWYRDELSKYVKDVLLDPKTLSRPYLDAGGVEAVVAEHTSGRGNNTLEIHRLLTAELLHRHLIDSI